jgi:hypothetical protein
MWSGMFIYVEGTLTAGQGCDICAQGGTLDNVTLQLNYQTSTGACTGLNSGMCLDIEDDNDSSTGAAINTSPAMAAGQGYFVIMHAAGAADANNDIYVLGEVTPGTLPWVVIGHGTKAKVTAAAATTTGSVTTGSTTLTVASGTGMAIGQSVGMTGVLAGATLASGSGTSWVLSIPAASTQTTVSAKFFAAAGGPYSFTFGKYSSCSMSNAVDFSSIIYDPYGVILPLIAAGTVSL